MDKDKLLSLLKSGIWEDALIAFTFMKKWDLDTVSLNLGGWREYGVHRESYRIEIGHNNILYHVKINEHLYAIGGGISTLGFYDTQFIDAEYIEI